MQDEQLIGWLSVVVERLSRRR